MSIWSPGHTVLLVCAGLELFQKGREDKGEQEAAGVESEVSLDRTPYGEEGDCTSSGVGVGRVPLGRDHFTEGSWLRPGG